MTMINIRWVALAVFTALILLGTSTIMDAALSFPLIAWATWLIDNRPKDLDVIVLEGEVSFEEGEVEYLAYLLAHESDEEEYDRVRVLQLDAERVRDAARATEE